MFVLLETIIVVVVVVDLLWYKIDKNTIQIDYFKG